jgi:hypothetical protein
VTLQPAASRSDALELAFPCTAAQVAGDRGDEAAEHGGGQARRVGHAESERNRDRERELPDRDLREEVVHAERRRVGHPAAHTARAESAPSAPNSAVISAAGTAIHDVAHFDQESARIMGERYAAKLLEMVSAR